jgi:teichuronic acid biosynthesis glycosyltransferase TuaC
MRLRVLSLATVFPSPAFPNHGLFVHERLRRLARRADVRVVAPIPLAQRVAVRHPPFLYIPRLAKGLDGWALALSSLPSVLRLVRGGFDFDVIDAHFGYPEGFAAMLLARAFRRPFAVTLRGSEPGLARERARGRALARALRAASAVIAVSGRLRDLAIGLGVRPSRVSVVPNGVDAEVFRFVLPAEARRRLAIEPAFLPEGARLLVAVGHLCPRKGFERIVAACAVVRARGPDARLAIVGGPGLEGDSRASIAAAIREHGMAGRVLLPGPADPERVALWHAAADVSVLASDHEGCPNVVLEALACGAPVVATDVGNVRDLVANPGDGIVVDPGAVPPLAAALERALETPWDRRGIASRAALRTWDNVAAETLDALEAGWARWLVERAEREVAGGIDARAAI